MAQLNYKDKVDIELDLFSKKEGKYTLIYSPALDLASQGLNEKEAYESFQIMLEIFLEETTRKGTLEHILLDLGWSLVKKPEPIYKPPKYDIPYPLLKKQRIALPI